VRGMLIVLRKHVREDMILSSCSRKMTSGCRRYMRYVRNPSVDKFALAKTHSCQKQSKSFFRIR